MKRAEGPGAGDWWAADFDVLPDAAVVNFVLQYYEHWDNNEGQDFKAAVEHQGGGCAQCCCCTCWQCQAPDTRKLFSSATRPLVCRLAILSTGGTSRPGKGWAAAQTE